MCRTKIGDPPGGGGIVPPPTPETVPPRAMLKDPNTPGGNFSVQTVLKGGTPDMVPQLTMVPIGRPKNLNVNGGRLKLLEPSNRVHETVQLIEALATGVPTHDRE